ncbi:MAG TPA: 2OG-Fe(II) oxygenase [Gammaproteobacteria bacterium]|nr:2OG-Fe(II) oxygenase [Gammaproteobacteria bacterium]
MSEQKKIFDVITDHHWQAAPLTISQQSIDDLFNNRIPYLLVENFLSLSECSLLVSAITKLGLGGYDYNFDINAAPPAQHLFETHYLYENKMPEDYFPAAEKSIHEYKKLCDEIKLYPDKKMMDLLSQYTQKPVAIASQEGKNYSHVIIRELKNSALLHADFAPFIPSYWSISNITAELAWNIYLSDAGKGGECVVYNKPWEKEDDKYITHDTYGYDHAVVKDKEFAEIYPTQGSLVLFNSRNFHEVRRSENPRISMGGHIGLTPAGEIIVWI